MILNFDAENHVYRLGAEILPSVSEICNRILGEAYKDVPPYILKRAAAFGTKVHEAIEFYNITGIEPDDLSLRQRFCFEEYIKISDGIKPLRNELRGHYKHFYAGTLDMIGEEGGQMFIYDYKTTSMFNAERVALQCSLYRLMYGWDKVAGIKCLWLPKASYGQKITLESWDKKELLKAIRGATKPIEKKEDKSFGCIIKS